MKKSYSDREIYLRSLKRNQNKILFLQIAIFFAFIAIWEITTLLGVIDSFFVSSPSRIWVTAVHLFKDGEIWQHIGITLIECILGFIISTAIGAIIAILLWWSNTMRKVLEPYLVVLNALPKIALGPIIIIWVGSGMRAIVAMAFLICIIVTVISLLNAFVGVDEGKIFLLRSMGASKWQILQKVVIPSAVPDFLSVLKINVGLSWVGTIMGEYLVSSAGLGYLIIYGGQVFQIDLVMTSTVILCLLAALMYALVTICCKCAKRFS